MRGNYMAVGQSISMVDSQLRVSGSIDYTLNFELPRMLHACMLRSPHAHARVVKVDASRAAKLPGVAAVLTRDDLIGDHIDPYFGLILQDQTPVALDRVRFVGEPVAAVAARGRRYGSRSSWSSSMSNTKSCRRCSTRRSAKAGSADCSTQDRGAVIAGRPDVTARSLEGTNIVHLFKQRKGDLDQGFRESDKIFENTYISPAVNHVALEPHVVVAQVSRRSDHRLDLQPESPCHPAPTRGNFQSSHRRCARDRVSRSAAASAASSIPNWNRRR